MSALNPNNTARLFLDYGIATGQPRSLQVRYAAPATPADVVAWLETLFTILEPSLGTGFQTIGTRVALAGSNVTLPGPAVFTVTPGGGTLVPALYPAFYAGQGRDAVTGRKAHISWYGMVLNTDASYRFNRGESALFDDVLDFLQTPVTGVNLSIAGNPVQWYDYINTGFNVYHQRNQRS